MTLPSRTVHILNLGAGVQSTTLYLMAMQGYFPCDHAVFADTGDEPVAVYKHLSWLLSLSGPPILVRTKGKLSEHLRNGCKPPAGRVASIPAYTLIPGQEREGRTRRQCSKEYKVEVIERCIRREILGVQPRYRIPKSTQVVQYVGISLDEAGRFERMIKRRTLGLMKAPLIERYMTRQDCLTWLAEHGNVPHEVPRSACVYCPMHDDAEWLRVKAVPEDWAKAVAVDESLRIQGNVVNRNMDAEMFLHRSCKPLVQIEFKPREKTQTSIPFYRDCLGVCGV